MPSLRGRVYRAEQEVSRPIRYHVPIWQSPKSSRTNGAPKRYNYLTPVMTSNSPERLARRAAGSTGFTVCGKKRNTLILSADVARRIALFLDLNQRGIPRFARNDAGSNRKEGVLYGFYFAGESAASPRTFSVNGSRALFPVELSMLKCCPYSILLTLTATPGSRSRLLGNQSTSGKFGSPTE